MVVGLLSFPSCPPHSAERPESLSTCTCQTAGPHPHVPAGEGPGAGGGMSEGEAVTDARQLTAVGLGSQADRQQAALWGGVYDAQQPHLHVCPVGPTGSSLEDLCFCPWEGSTSSII